MLDLGGKTALVTGGSRGIGKAIVLRLARQGADVAFSYRGNTDAATATVAEVQSLGRRALAIQADARALEDAEALVKQVLDAFGKVDILGTSDDGRHATSSVVQTGKHVLVLDTHVGVGQVRVTRAVQ